MRNSAPSSWKHSTCSAHLSTVIPCPPRARTYVPCAAQYSRAASSVGKAAAGFQSWYVRCFRPSGAAAAAGACFVAAVDPASVSSACSTARMAAMQRRQTVTCVRCCTLVRWRHGKLATYHTTRPRLWYGPGYCSSSGGCATTARWKGHEDVQRLHGRHVTVTSACRLTCARGWRVVLAPNIRLQRRLARRVQDPILFQLVRKLQLLHTCRVHGALHAPARCLARASATRLDVCARR